MATADRIPPEDIDALAEYREVEWNREQVAHAIAFLPETSQLAISRVPGTKSLYRIKNLRNTGLEWDDDE